MLVKEPIKRIDAKSCSEQIKLLTTKEYDFLSLLNSGLFSNKYSAIHSSTGRKKQIKLINSKSLSNKDHLKVTLQETKLIIQVKTPMLISTWDQFFIENKHLYLVMDLDIQVSLLLFSAF